MPEEPKDSSQEDKTKISQPPPQVRGPIGGLPPPIRPVAAPGPGTTPVRVPTVSPTRSTGSSGALAPPPATVKLTPATVPLPVVQLPPQPPKTEGIPTGPAGGVPAGQGPDVRRATRRLRPATGGVVPSTMPSVILPVSTGSSAVAESGGTLAMVGMVLSILTVLFLVYACFLG